MATPKKSTSPTAAVMRAEFQGACRMPDDGILYPGELGASPGTRAAEALAWYKENGKQEKELAEAGYKMTPGNRQDLVNKGLHYDLTEAVRTLPVCDKRAQAHTIEVRAAIDF